MAERFEGTLERRGSRTMVEVPFDVRDVFGKARAPVRGTVNGYPFQTTVAVYGGRYFLGFRREIREAAGFDDGDRLAIVLERDDEPARSTRRPSSMRRSPAIPRRGRPSTGCRTRTGASTSSGCPAPSARKRAGPGLSEQSPCCATASSIPERVSSPCGRREWRR